VAIGWSAVRDRHASGNTELGKVWLRTDRAGLVTGVYTLFGRTRKYVPKPEESWTVEDGKAVAELALEDAIAFRERFPN